MPESRPPCADLPEHDFPEHDRRGAARAWIQRGLALLNHADPRALEDAIRCFERTIELRSGDECSDDPWARWELSAGWLNRGEALAKLGGAERLALAVQSYDTALAMLTAQPRSAHSWWRRREAIAWLNRAVAQREIGGSKALHEALISLGHVIALFQDDDAIGESEDQRILGVAWMNRGNTLLQLGGERFMEDALAAANRSLDQLKTLEETDAVSAEASIKARVVACRAIAHVLDAPATASEAWSGWLHAATDHVDDGLRLGRRWRVEGEDRLVPMLIELFRFGARLYQRFQPQFLGEFLIESLDPDRSPGALPMTRGVHKIAIDTLWRSLGMLRSEGFRSMDTPRYQQWMSRLTEYEGVERRLNELRTGRG